MARSAAIGLESAGTTRRVC